MDTTEIELMADMLDQRDRIISRLERERDQLEQEHDRDQWKSKCQTLEKRIDAILADREREYLKGRRPEADERLARMLNENEMLSEKDPGGSNFRVGRQ